MMRTFEKLFASTSGRVVASQPMDKWQITHGAVIGAYLKVDGVELYVRKDGAKSWLWFVDGVRMGAAHREIVARAAAEAAVRAMSRTHMGAMAAPAG